MSDIEKAFYEELIKTAISIIPLVITWLLGQRFIAYWDIKKKKHELNMATSKDFYKLYGEFKELSRLWRTFKKGESGITFPDTFRLELLKRACTAESGVEAIIVRQTTEQRLNDEDIRVFGLFRQAYQKLREAIRDDEPLEWTYKTVEYRMFNKLAGAVSAIIASNSQKQAIPEDAIISLSNITKVRNKDWYNELPIYKKSLGEEGQSLAIVSNNEEPLLEKVEPASTGRV